MSRAQAIDSHTEGEPTRVFIVLPGLGGGPDIDCRSATVHAWIDAWRRPDGSWRVPEALLRLVAEPRAAPATVGALWCRPSTPSAVGGVLFFNSAGALGMCGHGTIGLAESLRWLGGLSVGTHTLETPVGHVRVRLVGDGSVEFENVPAYRHAAGVTLEIDGGIVRGDVAWGGNWFFLVDEDADLELGHSSVDRHLRRTRAIRDALGQRGVRGASGAVIDHVALFGPPSSPDANSRNFVLCPNDSYDRSPCGTGTSAKLACLAADGRLAPGQRWRQESVIGSRFDATYLHAPGGQPGHILPSIRGRAWVTGEVRPVVEPTDPATASGWLEAAKSLSSRHDR